MERREEMEKEGVTQFSRELIEHDSNQKSNVETLCVSCNRIYGAELQWDPAGVRHHLYFFGNCSFIKEPIGKK